MKQLIIGVAAIVCAGAYAQSAVNNVTVTKERNSGTISGDVIAPLVDKQSNAQSIDKQVVNGRVIDSVVVERTVVPHPVCSGDLHVNGKGAQYVCEGSLRENVERISNSHGMKKVIWQGVPECIDWENAVSFEIPPEELEDTVEMPLIASVLGYVLDEYPLIPEVTMRGNLVVIHPTRQFKCGEY